MLVTFCLIYCFQRNKINKFESDSQPNKDKKKDLLYCFQRNKINKFESDSQHRTRQTLQGYTVFNETKLTNLKAIHNTVANYRGEI